MVPDPIIDRTIGKCNTNSGIEMSKKVLRVQNCALENIDLGQKCADCGYKTETSHSGDHQIPRTE